MQIHDPIAVNFDGSPDPLPGGLVWTDVQQDAGRIPNERNRPVGNHDRPDDARERIHPEPAVRFGQEQTCNSQYGYKRISEDMDIRGADAVVAGSGFGWGGGTGVIMMVVVV
jgi:hypothetical protein